MSEQDAPLRHGKLVRTAMPLAGRRPSMHQRDYISVRYFSRVTTSQTNSPRDHLDVSDLISAIENFNRFYIRLPALQTLSFTTLSVLDTLNSRGPTRLTKLARTEQISQPGLTQLVTCLEQDGLVERRPDPTDGRAVLVQITDAGRQVGASRLKDRTRAWSRSSPNWRPRISGRSPRRSPRSPASRNSATGTRSDGPEPGPGRDGPARHPAATTAQAEPPRRQTLGLSAALRARCRP